MSLDSVQEIVKAAQPISVSAIPFGVEIVNGGAVVLMTNATSLVSDLQLLILSLTQILQFEEGIFGTNQGYVLLEVLYPVVMLVKFVPPSVE